MAELAELAERQVKHMGRLLDDLLDVSRVVRGVITLRKEAVDLASALGRSIEAVRPLVESRRQTLTFPAPPSSVTVEADPTRLEQVFVNLLTNASRYTDPGGSIWLSAEQAGAEAVVRVRDSGIGIEPALLPHVFALFTQGRRDAARSEGGLGIGLTLVKRLAELHGGTVEALSGGAGLGSEFIVRLPTLVPQRSATPAPETQRHDEADSSAPACAPARPLRILVVDDNEDAARSLARLLGRWMHEAHCVHDGPSALAATEALRPDVLLLDLGLPGMGGLEVGARLRQHPEFLGTTLIALTGYGQAADREQTRQAGFDAHLVKPVAPDELKLILSNVKL